MKPRSERCHKAMSQSAKRFLTITAMMMAFASPAFAVPVEQRPEIEVKVEPTWSSSRAEALDALFADLKAARTEEEAERIANKIDARFRQSGSDTLDVIAGRAREAMAKGDVPIAVELLSRVIALQPDWAEAWSLRATAFFVMGDPERSRLDAIETLAREPRHFGALTGLALISEMQGQKKDALRIYRQVQDLAPQLKPIKSAVERLAKELEQPM